MKKSMLLQIHDYPQSAVCCRVADTMLQHTVAMAQAKERRSVADKEFLKLETFVFNAHMVISAWRQHHETSIAALFTSQCY